MFEKANNILNQRLGKHNLLRSTQSAYVCYEADKIIKKYFKSDQIQVANFASQTLTINVPNTSWSSEIQLKKDIIIRKINQKMKKNSVKFLRTRVR